MASLVVAQFLHSSDITIIKMESYIFSSTQNIFDTAETAFDSQALQSRTRSKTIPNMDRHSNVTNTLLHHSQ